MGNWTISWNFDKSSYSLGEQALASYRMKNTGENPLYLSDLKLDFDFGAYNLESISGKVAPREDRFLGNIWLTLPKNVVGRKFFTCAHRFNGRIGDFAGNISTETL